MCPEQVRRHLVLEQFDTIDGHDRHPYPIAPSQLRVTVDIHRDQGKWDRSLLGAEHLLGVLAQVAAHPGVERDRLLHFHTPKGFTEGYSFPRFMVPPDRFGRHRWAWRPSVTGRVWRRARTPGTSRRRRPRAPPRACRSGRGTRTRRRRPLTTAPPSTTSVPTTLPATASIRTASGRKRLPSGTRAPARSVAVTGASTTSTRLAALNASRQPR